VPFLRKLFRELYTSLGCASTGKHWDWDHLDTDHMNDQTAGSGGAVAGGVAIGGKKEGDDDVIIIDSPAVKTGTGGLTSSAAVLGVSINGGVNMQQIHQYSHSMDMLRPSTAAAVAPYNPREIINLADDDDDESANAIQAHEPGDDHDAAMGLLPGAHGSGGEGAGGIHGYDNTQSSSLSALAQEEANRLKILRSNNNNYNNNNPSASASGISADYNAIALTSNIAQKRPHTSHISGSGMNTISYTSLGGNHQISGTLGNGNGIKKAIADGMNVEDVSRSMQE
jgi:hypothetical protein